jgi:hypothetical protein
MHTSASGTHSLHPCTHQRLVGPEILSEGWLATNGTAIFLID